MIHHKELPCLRYQHDLVRDILFAIFRETGVSVKKDVLVNFPTNPHERRSTLRPSYILVFEWIGEKHARVDKSFSTRGTGE